MKILVVDDEPDTCEFLGAFLTSEGHKVRCAGSSGELFLAVGEFNPDLILLDIMLPGLDGLDAARALRTETYTCGIPIIHISARKDAEAKARAAEYSVPYLEKPFSCGQLLDELQRVLEI